MLGKERREHGTDQAEITGTTHLNSVALAHGARQIPAEQRKRECQLGLGRESFSAKFALRNDAEIIAIQKRAVTRRFLLVARSSDQDLVKHVRPNLDLA